MKKGEIVGFLGPNGAGKTTTMRMIAGFTAATTGKVTVAGHDMANDNYEGAKKIGYLPEHPPLYDVFTVERYLRFVAKVKRVNNSRLNSELDRVMTACRLETVTNKEIYKLSKGYRQRVGLAQALLGGSRCSAARRANSRFRSRTNSRNTRSDQVIRARSRGLIKYAHTPRGDPHLPTDRYH